MTTANFSFGKTGIEVSVPNGYNTTVIHNRSAQAIADVDKALGAALDAPIGSPSLMELARGKRTAAISICDITRPAPNHITLPPLLKRLHAAGIPVEGITILIATGLHRAATPEEIDIIVGPEIASKYKIISHDARMIEEHRYLGSTRRGTPVYIDERFVSADLHITLGFIEQHLMLGFSGGRKLIAPGVAAAETIKVIHSPRFMREPMATEGSTANNPIHAELLEIASMARHDFSLDVTLTLEREISGIFAGEPVQAHATGMTFVEQTCLKQFEEPFDVAITSAAGYPLDLTFYQIIKGVTAAQHMVRPGGRILIVAECAEGSGAEEFSKKLHNLNSYEAFLDEIHHAPVEVDQWQLERLALVGQRFEVLFHTPGVKKEEMGFLAANAYSSIEEAVAAALKGLPTNARVALVPEGPYTFVRAGEAAQPAQQSQLV